MSTTYLRGFPLRAVVERVCSLPAACEDLLECGHVRPFTRFDYARLVEDAEYTPPMRRRCCECLSYKKRGAAIVEGGSNVVAFPGAGVDR